MTTTVNWYASATDQIPVAVQSYSGAMKLTEHGQRLGFETNGRHLFSPVVPLYVGAQSYGRRESKTTRKGGDEPLPR